MSRTSVQAGVSADWNQQGKTLVNNNWENQTRVQYEINDICTYQGSMYQCIKQSDASVNSERIPTNTTYWKLIGGVLTDANVKTKYEANSNTNAFTDDDKTKLGSALQAIPAEYVTETEGDARYIKEDERSEFASAADGAKARTALQVEVNDVVAGESDYVDAIKEAADAATTDKNIVAGDSTYVDGIKTIADSALQSVPNAYKTQTENDTRYATAAQGGKADTALQSFTETNNVVSGDSAYVDGIKTTADSALQSVPSEYLTQNEGDARYSEVLDFEDTANSTDKLGVNFTNSTDKITGYVDYSSIEIDYSNVVDTPVFTNDNRDEADIVGVQWDVSGTAVRGSVNVSGKQNVLTPGNGISIIGNVINSTPSSGSGSTSFSDYKDSSLYVSDSSTTVGTVETIVVKLQFGGVGNFIYRKITLDSLDESVVDEIYSNEDLTILLSTKGD